MTAQVTASPRRAGRELRDSLTAQSWISPKSGKPYCLLRWGGRKGRLTPRETRALGMALIGVAAAAESDAALIRAMRDEMQIDGRMTVQVLSTVRGLREWAARASAVCEGVTVYAGCPYPGAHLHPRDEDEDEDEGEDEETACDPHGSQDPAPSPR